MSDQDGHRRPRDLKYSVPDHPGAEHLSPDAPGAEHLSPDAPGAEHLSADAPGAEHLGEAPVARPTDPERGLRGVISAILIFEAIAILLGLTVIANGGRSAPLWEIATVSALALAHIVTPALIRKRIVFPVIFTLQAALIGCWVISGAIGAMGVVFLAVWMTVVMMRREFRRRLAASEATGTIGGQ